MNFYQAQDDARKQSLMLVALFSVAIVALILLTNLVVAIFVWFSDPSNVANSSDLSHLSLVDKLWAIITGLGWHKALWITGLVSGVVFIAMFFKWLSLRSGGRAVAESLGATLIPVSTRDADEKKLLNVVEEMALASGVPVPPVYLMKHENSINAFAAGYSSKDAVIGVSNGCMTLLDREQLQGVIAHEFSHILNGDMRLNLRIISVLHGILMIGEMGRFFMDITSSRRSYRYSSRRDNKAAAGIMLFGLALFVLGWIGYFFGALIKAAVSRQREYLADASAVQFTRNPDGIGGALQLIGGHSMHGLIGHHSAQEMSHMFFAQSFNGKWLATHPPLEDRIRQVLPKWNGRFIKPTKTIREPLDPLKVVQEQARRHSAASAPSSGFVSLEQALAAQEAGVVSDATAQSSIDAEDRSGLIYAEVDSSIAMILIPVALKEMAHEPLEALGVCLAMLLDSDDRIRAQQRSLIDAEKPQFLTLTDKAYVYTQALAVDAYQPLLEMLIPAIKSFSVKQYTALKRLMTTLIRADGNVDLKEWLIFELIRQHGDRHFSLVKEKAPKYRTVKSVEYQYVVVLSRLVHYGTSDEALQKKAFGVATNASGMYASQMLPVDQCSGATFTRAIHDLSQAYPLLKPRLMKGLVQAAKADASIDPYERMIVSIIALIWDCPLIGLEVD